MRVVAIGEVVVDWISTEPGRRFEDISMFCRSLGGNACNVAIGVSRLGTPSRLIGKVGDDLNGRYLTEILKREKVDVDHLIVDKRYPTAQCYVLSSSEDENSFYNWPNDNAAQMLEAKDVTAAGLEGAAMLHATGISLTREPRTSSIVHALKLARDMGLIVSFDSSYPTGEESKAREAAVKCMHLAHLIKVNLGELLYWANDHGEPGMNHCHSSRKGGNCDGGWPVHGDDVSSKRLAEQGLMVLEGSGKSLGPVAHIKECAKVVFEKYQPHALLVTLGLDGSYVLSAAGEAYCRPHVVRSVAGVGAGDAYISGMLHALSTLGVSGANHLSGVSESQWQRLGTYANAVGALATTKLSASEGLPRAQEVESLLASAT